MHIIGLPIILLCVLFITLYLSIYNVKSIVNCQEYASL